jgi:hypothetical protein
MVDMDRIRNILDDYFWMSSGSKVEISEQGLVSVVGNVNMKRASRKLPCRFGEIKGSFSCVSQDLTSLDGAPHLVSGDFSCQHNKLKTLAGGPVTVGGAYNCQGQALVGLLGLPLTEFKRLYVTYTPKLPVLRALVARKIWLETSDTVARVGPKRREVTDKVEQILNDPRWMGKGQAGAIACAAELASAGFKANARW